MNREEHIILLQRLLIFCGFTLIGCIVFKLFGTEVFDLKVTNERLLFIDNFVSNHFIFRQIIKFISYSLNVLIISSLVTGSEIKTWFKSFKPTWFVLLVGYLTRAVLPYNFILFLYDFLFILFINYTLSGDVFLKRSIKFNVLVIFYQASSMFLRSITFSFTDTGFAINCILMLDYYILLVSTYVYVILNKQKGDV